MGKLEIYELGALFEQVQMRSIMPDGKTFPDCIPKRDLDAINADFQKSNELPGFDLANFVRENFNLPKAYSSDYKSDVSKPVGQHVQALWDVLTRKPDQEKSSLIPLPFPYIVPGGRFREIYYWDSYFTMLGLRVSGRTDMIRSMIDNFSFLIDRIGYIPNGNRSYFVGRSQPPFYSLMIRLLYDEVIRSGEAKGQDILIRYLPEMEKEYLFWMSGTESLSKSSPALNRVVRLDDGEILNRYWDNLATPRPEAFREDVELSHQSREKPEVLFRHLRAAAESGWDFSSRWFRDVDSFATIHTTDIIPVDLNCLVLHLEQTLAEAHQLAGDSKATARYLALAEKRKILIQKYCWNEKEHFYFDYDFVEHRFKPNVTLAAAFPIFFGVATAAQAEHVAGVIRERFLKPGGLTTTLSATGQQWDAPNGWAPLQWIAYKGLLRYGHETLANQVKTNWTNSNLKVYKKTGKMTEKYDVWNEDGEASGGEYPNQDGFGWTNGVFLAMSS